MSYGRLPGIPRGRLRSHADDEPIPERVYEVLQGFDARVGGLEEAVSALKSLAEDSKLGQARIVDKLEDIKATDRHALTKMIGGLAGTAILTIGSILGGQQLLKPGAPTPPPIARSALDVRLDTCRPMPAGPSREECFARVTAETEH